MTGKLTLDHAAHIEVEISESNGTHEFIIDTGFSDFLYLPEDRIAAWNLPFLGTVPMTLADRASSLRTSMRRLWIGSEVPTKLQ